MLFLTQCSHKLLTIVHLAFGKSSLLTRSGDALDVIKLWNVALRGACLELRLILTEFSMVPHHLQPTTP